MPLYDFQCPDCGTEYEDKIAGVNDVWTCGCGAVCKRLTGNSTFKVNGHNESNGYSYKKSVLDNPPR